MYNKIIDGLSRRVPEKEASGFTFVQADGKRKYTALKNRDNETSYTTEILVNQLDGDIFDSDYLCCSPNESDITAVDVSSLAAAVLDNFYRPSDSYIKFENGRAKLDFFKTRDFQIDKYIGIDESKGIPNVTGIVLDLEERPEFREACSEGISCDMPNCVQYYKDIEGKNEDDVFNIAEQYGDENFRKEIVDLMNKTIDKVSAGAEVVPRGLYFIMDNKVFYLSALEYRQIYDSVPGYSRDNLYDLIETPGFYQLNSGLIKNKEHALITMGVVRKALGALGEKKYFDLANVQEHGFTIEDFLSRILSNDTKAFELLDSIVKEQVNVPKR